MPAPGFLFLALLLSLAFTACGGDGGGGAATAPPPPSPLSWSDVPESATIQVGEKKETVLSLSSAVTATYTHSASTGNVTLAGQSPRAGIYTLEITGVQAGETTVTVTAMAEGYVTATATFPVTVELRPLAWTNLPTEIELEVGDQETVNLQLNALVLPELQMEPSNTNVAVSAECVLGACEMTVVGLAAGESVITVTATAEGYTGATGEINVTVRLRPLEWTNIPDEVEVELSRQEMVRLRLSREVLPEFRVETSNDNVAAHGECRVGECELIIAGIDAGETRVTVIATADGYTEAREEIAVTVTLRRLEWTDLPDEIELDVGSEVTARLRLSQPVRPDLEVDVSNRNVAAFAECRTGVCELTVEALFEGESVITLTATADGYTEARGEIAVTVTLRRLEWTDLPGEIELEVGSEVTARLRLSQPVRPDLEVDVSNRNVTAFAECRTGVCELTVEALLEGESVITFTAKADGYTEARGEIAVTVTLRPLEWTDLPDEIELDVGSEVTARLRLSQPVRPNLEVDVSNRNVAAFAECRTGVCELTVEALFEGESVITLTATADGYTDATGEIEVFVTDPFQLALWRELVFDGYDCPRADSTTRCTRLWGGRAVEDRITSVLPSQPNFQILTTARFTFGTYRFTPSDVETIKDAIRDAVPQTTGERFDGRITTSSTSLRDQDGWVDIIPIGNDFWEDGVGPCGAANVGARNGTIIVNVDRLDDCGLLPVAMHEVGHALGFFHVLDLGDYMMSPFLSGIPPVFHDDEQYHARLAWESGRGARYTPDQRRRSLATLTPDAFSPAFSPGGQKTLEGLTWALALKELVQCRAR